MQGLQDVGIDLSQRGAAVQDMLWFTSVQFRGLTRGIVQGALKVRDQTPDDSAQTQVQPAPGQTRETETPALSR